MTSREPQSTHEDPIKFWQRQGIPPTEQRIQIYQRLCNEIDSHRLLDYLSRNTKVLEHMNISAATKMFSHAN